MLHTLIAFANTAGGLLVIGVENGTKRVRGLLDPLKEEERLASLISDRIAPRLIPTIDVIAWRFAQLIVAEVFPSSNRPHYLKNLGPEEGVFVRIGSTNRKADAALMQELRRMRPLAGLDSNPELLGEAAVDLLVGQLQANELGIPKHEKIIAVRGQWVAGTSVRGK